MSGFRSSTGETSSTGGASRAAKEEPTGARVAWTGSNDSLEQNAGIKIRLFATTWTNPHPEKEVATLDILSAGTDCDPFLVAVTLERDK